MKTLISYAILIASIVILASCKQEPLPFHPGDKVVFKGGGPIMVVEDFWGFGPPWEVECVYYDKDGVLHTQNFSASLLDKADGSSSLTP